MDYLKTKIQTSNATEFNRYPAIFSLVKTFLIQSTESTHRILSFGCSTGEEIASLDSLYVSNCQIVGMDINKEAIAVAKKNVICSSNACKFFTAEDFDYSSRFNAVLALSVLCSWPETKKEKDISRIYPFADFERQAESLDLLLDSGGVLVIHNSNYYFEDTSIFARKYEICFPESTDIGFVARFDLNSVRYSNSRKGAVFFRKVRS